MKYNKLELLSCSDTKIVLWSGIITSCVTDQAHVFGVMVTGSGFTCQQFCRTGVECYCCTSPRIAASSQAIVLGQSMK